MTMIAFSCAGRRGSTEASVSTGVQLKIATGFVLTLACLTLFNPLQAQALTFSPGCNQHQAVPVVAPKNALLLTKQPAPHPTGTATIFDVINLDAHVIPAGSNSCVLTPVPVGGDYCFQARNDRTILTAGIGAIVNPGGLTACQ